MNKSISATIGLPLSVAFLQCIVFLSPVFSQSHKNYHRPVFRRHVFENDYLRLAIDYDKADSESVNEIPQKIALATTLSQEVAEAHRDLDSLYPLNQKKLYGALYSKYTYAIKNSESTELERNLYIKDDYYDLYRLGTEEWARKNVRSVHVRKSIAEKFKHASNSFHKFWANQKRPFWPVIGLSAHESEDWTPYKYTLLLDTIKNSRTITPNQFAFYPSMTNLEKHIAEQIAQAYCEDLCERYQKERIVSLMDKFLENPRSFWVIFKNTTGSTGLQTFRAFTDAVRKEAENQHFPIMQGKILLSESALIGKPVISHNEKYIAFVSDYLSSREERADLFICNRNGSGLTFAATEASGSMAWDETTDGLFFVRSIVSAAGKRFNQLCWVPCTSPTGKTDLRRGLNFSSLVRGTQFSEVDVSTDNKKVSILITRPEECELKVYTIHPRRRLCPTLKLYKTIKVGGIYHQWISNDAIVYVESSRGMWRIVKHTISTDETEIIDELSERVYDMDYSKDSNTLYYSIAWAHHKGHCLRAIDLSRLPLKATSVRVFPLGGFHFSVTDSGKDLYYTTFRDGDFKIATCKTQKADNTYSLSQLTAKEPCVRQAHVKEIDSANDVNITHTDFNDWNLSKPLLRPHTKVLADFDTFNVSLIWRDELEQRLIEPTIWYDWDYDRVSWQFRYSGNDSHPNWYVGLFDTTTDDFLNLFPISKFTNEAFFKGATVGINHYMTARETLSFSLEMKDNIYEPEFFDGAPVPTELKASNNMYRVRYKWDTKELMSTDYVGSLGGRLVEISWADSPGFTDSDIKFTETLIDWREYIPVGPRNKNILAMRLLGGVRNQRQGHEYPVKFTLGGSDTLRGVQDDSLEGNKFALASIEYRYKLFDRNKAVQSSSVLRDPTVSSLFFFDSFYTALFIDSAVASFDRITMGQDNQTGVGIEFRANAYLTRWRPANLRLGFAHGLNSLGENRVYLSTGLIF